MPAPKKSLLACVSAAALVASFGFVQAQDAEDNLNSPYVADSERSTYGLNDHTTLNPPAADAMGTMAADPSSTAADSSYAPPAAGAESTGVAPTTQSGGYQRDVGVRGTPCIPEGSVGQRGLNYDPATADPECLANQSTTVTTTSSDLPPAAATPTPPVAAAEPSNNMTVTSAPETRIDLNSPSEPLYNLPPEGERAPRPDRN